MYDKEDVLDGSQRKFKIFCKEKNICLQWGNFNYFKTTCFENYLKGARNYNKFAYENYVNEIQSNMDIEVAQ